MAKALPEDVEWSRVLAVIGAAAVVGSGLLPWFQRLGDPSRGYVYAEWHIAIGGLLLLLAVVSWQGWERRALVVSWVVGALVAWIAYTDFETAGAYATHDAAIGLYVLAAGGALLLIVPGVAAVERDYLRKARRPKLLNRGPARSRRR